MSIAQMQYKLQRNLLILAVGLFALSAVDYAEQQKMVMTTVMAVAAALNLLAFLMSRFFGAFATAMVSLANAAVAGFIAFDLLTDDKQYLPYVWAGAAVLYLVATVIALIKALREKKPQ